MTEVVELNVILWLEMFRGLNAGSMAGEERPLREE